MYEWFKSLFKDILARIWRLVTDVYRVFWEWIYGIISEVLQWFVDKAGDLVVAAIDAIGPLLPADTLNYVLAAYEWLEYIESWVPLSFGLNLLLSYFAIVLSLMVSRYFLSVVFGSRNPI